MKVLLLTLFVIGVATAAENPVLLLADSPTRAALTTIQNEEFSSILTPLAKDHMIVAIQESGLSSHDFLCKRNCTESQCSAVQQQQSCYAHLSSISPKTFYRSVKNANKVLESLDPDYSVVTLSNSGKLETPLKCQANKVVFLRFNEETELSRAETLEAHDFAIANLMKEVSCPTVFLYTSTPARGRSRRAVSVSETAAPEGGYIFSDTKFQIFFTNLTVQIGSAASKEIIISNMKIVENNSTDFTVTLTSATAADTITFDIALVSGYYYMKLLTYNNATQFRTNGINAPPAFSYYCGNLTVSSTAGDQLFWNSVQFQAPFGATVTAAGTYFEFGESWNCVGFVTPAILGGLFVSAILLTILFIGICWMMDINTMDRFDDPKGKTITISANE
ncbi:V-type proton ATPase subunit S1 [Anastrepha ludens]|uniref:V-type proton ATPase subunit S1 n=1 Tax=Anastrepha ludens TaxID=28586 RepID=UPI0023B18AAD|nr:V-type proton ATPase subunit S1 [Anastrepha ludens]